MDCGRQKRINSTTIWLLKNSFRDIKQLRNEIKAIKNDFFNPYIYLTLDERIEFLDQIKWCKEEIRNLKNFIYTLRAELTIC